MADRDELETLRRRAYGPGADIHEDVAALERLRALEQRDRPEPPSVAQEPARPDVAFPFPFAEVVVDKEPEPEHELRGRVAARAVLSVLGRAAARLAHVRRSTCFAIAGLAAVASLIATTLLVVERVQPDPLQTGAEQLARLSPDAGYPTLDFFTSSSTGARTFQAFHGVRVVVFASDMFGSASGGTCMGAYSERDAQSNDNGFSGQLLWGCAVGSFPAHTQFRSDLTGFPGELKSAFPGPTAIQMVYDSEHDEVVVFASPIDE